MTLVGRKVQTTQAVNVRTREMLVSLMAADLRESFGVNDVAVDDFVKNLRKELLGKHATENLARKDGLTKAFDLFDTFKVKKLTERKFTQGTAMAQRNYTYKSLAFDNKFAEETRLAGARFEAPLKALADFSPLAASAAEARQSDDEERRALDAGGFMQV